VGTNSTTAQANIQATSNNQIPPGYITENARLYTSGNVYTPATGFYYNANYISAGYAYACYVSISASVGTSWNSYSQVRVYSPALSMDHTPGRSPNQTVQ